MRIPTFIKHAMRCLLFLLGLTPCILSAQFNSIWIGGTSGNLPDQGFGGSLVRFYPDTTIVEFIEMPADIITSTTTISTSPEALSFYSNNCIIINRNHEIMEGGDSLWYPTEKNTEEWCGKGYGHSILRRGILAMPIPDKPEHYIQFYLRYDTITQFNDFPTTLLTCEVDMTQNSGLGKVINRKNIVFQDTFADQIDVVRHGNGRDWWIFIDKVGTNKMWAFLLSPSGISNPVLRDVPAKWDFPPRNYNLFYSQFSNDGNYYARTDRFLGTQLFKFNRCTATFSCPKILNVDFTGSGPGSVAFSLNNRFLYVNNYKELYQFDLYSNDIENSKLLIDTFDGFNDLPPGQLFNTYFGWQQMMADGKIYMSGGYNMRYLHVINNPDGYGKSCNFVQRGIKLPTYAGASLPMFPNFHLYDWDNSPCDTLGIDSPEPERPELPLGEFRLIPNPAREQVEIVFPEACGKGEFKVFNSTGYKVKDNVINMPYSYFVDTHDWPAGIYFVEFISEKNMRFFKKLAIVH